MSELEVETAVEKPVTREGFRARCGAGPTRTSLGADLRLSPTELAALARIRPLGGNRQEASPRNDSRPVSQSALSELEEDFTEMERRPGGGGAGAFVWLLAMLTASEVAGTIAWAIHYAQGGW